MGDHKHNAKYSLGATDESYDLENPSAPETFEITYNGKEKSNNSLIPSQPTKSQKARRYLGKNIPILWGTHEPILTIGPDWPFFLCMWSILIIVGIVMVIYITNEQSFLIQALTVGITIWQAFIYLLTSLKNPGIYTLQNPDDKNWKRFENDPNFCDVCRILKNENIYHCEDCNVCIKGYDHHCPWTGKCIGQGNLIQFYTFLVSTVVYLVFFMLVTLHAL